MESINNLPIEKNAMHHLCLMRAYVYAYRDSHDQRTQNGAVLLHPDAGIVLGSANQYPYPDHFSITDEMREVPEKYRHIVCAERSVLYEAASRGIVTNGLHLCCPFISCSECAKAIVRCKIAKVIGHKQLMDRLPERWQSKCNDGINLLLNSGIEVVLWDGIVFEDRDIEITFDEKPFNP